MPATAKRKPEIAAPAPEIPPDRVPLARAIEAKHAADKLVAQHADAIAKARRARFDASASEAPKPKTAAEEWDDDEWSMDEPDTDAELVAAADETDLKTATALLLQGKPVIAAWRGDNARRTVASRQEKRELIAKALSQLGAELVELEAAAALAQSAVMIEVNRLIAPIAAGALARLQSLRSETAMTQGMLAALLRDNPPAFPPDDSVFIRRLDAQKSRVAVFGSLRTEAERFRTALPGNLIAEQHLTTEFAGEIGRQIAALCLDPLAPLPSLPEG
jgi:hypothetical protein